MKRVLERRQPDLQVVVDNVHDPHNAAAILRTCDALGAAVVNLLYSRQEAPELSKGVSGDAQKWLELRWFSNALECVEAIREAGIKFYATYIDRSSVDFREVDWTQPSAVAFGNEHSGCSAELVEMADGLVRIPMAGMAQSFNVSVSAAIVLAEASRQRVASGQYEPRWDDWREQQLQAWIERESTAGS